jgi:putative Holliday junction resolvase
LTKILSIDVGEKRIGLAASDETQMIAAPFGFLDREGSIEKILGFILAENIGRIVVGMPYMPSGSLGTQSKDVQKYIAELRAVTNLDIDLENEVLSSVEAIDRLKMMKRKIKDKGEVDAMAAAVILESYMNRCKYE